MSIDNLPIDIHLNKLLDWLISRRHCNKDFQQNLNDIRSKIVSAIKDMPENERIQELLSKSHLNYITCRQIVEILKETEADSKNIFGYYSSQRMKDWKEIISAYEKDNVYLAELAQIIARNVTYEVPALKKQLNKLLSLQEECLKKQNDFVKQSHKFKSEYSQNAQKLGIKGEDINKELLQLLSEPPKYIDDVVADIPLLNECREYYTEFLKFTTERTDFQCLSTIEHLLLKGNTTYYEYRTGIEPEVIENVKFGEEVLSEVDTATSDNQIDFGDDSASTGTTSNGNGDFVHIDKSDLPDEGTINWDTNIEAGDISMIDIPAGPKVARGIDALTVLQHSVTRNNFINELFELQCFLSQRVHEMTSASNFLSSYQFQGAPKLVQLSTVETLQKMHENVDRILNTITNEAVLQFCMMTDNAKYIESVKQKLMSKLELSEKAVQKSEAMIEMAKKCAADYEETKPKIELLIGETQEIQKFIESDVSKRYKNRPVNIMGGVQIC
ncbi:CDK5 regulatory subunit-associated protein 3-like protein [Leptotrombidium deliense]|uniref:CDK5 regulatory subunit-associated protein 3-like protein n=1 Tax=Leptotrombidium deliense TaxID=299467 RepID=A0A443SEV9_9ACAR|nr:CDK5 regulatory subunit-associated protein 3-like protein [Leptotrombidium deliense]